MRGNSQTLADKAREEQNIMAKEPKTFEQLVSDKIQSVEVMAAAGRTSEYEKAAYEVAKQKRALARKLARESLSEDCQDAINRRLEMSKQIANKIMAEPSTLSALDPATHKANLRAAEKLAEAEKQSKKELALQVQIEALTLALAKTTQPQATIGVSDSSILASGCVSESSSILASGKGRNGKKASMSK